MIKKLGSLLAAAMIFFLPLHAAAEQAGKESAYVLDRVVVPSRYNILESPPVKAALSLKGIQNNEYGFIAESDLLDRFREAAEAYELLTEEYAGLEDAA